MQETVGRVTSLEQRVRTMDMELKEHFLEMRTFMSEALAGVESRLDSRIDDVEKSAGARFDSLEARLARFDRDVKAGFQMVDGRLGRVERRLDQIDLKFDLVIRRLPGSARATGASRRPRRKPGR